MKIDQSKFQVCKQSASLLKYSKSLCIKQIFLNTVLLIKIFIILQVLYLFLKMSKGHLNLKSVFNKERTFRPKKHFEPGTTKFDLHKKAQASLRSGIFLCLFSRSLQEVIINDFFGEINLEFFLQHQDKITKKPRGKISQESIVTTQGSKLVS